jgi:hypothetical protein
MSEDEDEILVRATDLTDKETYIACAHKLARDARADRHVAIHRYLHALYKEYPEPSYDVTAFDEIKRAYNLYLRHGDTSAGSKRACVIKYKADKAICASYNKLTNMHYTRRRILQEWFAARGLSPELDTSEALGLDLSEYVRSVGDRGSYRLLPPSLKYYAADRFKHVPVEYFIDVEMAAIRYVVCGQSTELELELDNAVAKQRLLATKYELLCKRKLVSMETTPVETQVHVFDIEVLEEMCALLEKRVAVI